MTFRTSLLLGAVVLASFVQAQPEPFGCHYFRNTPGPISWTAGSREQIDETIARSDTFDILHYDIALDVTATGASTIRAATTITFVPLLEDQIFIRFDLFQLTVDSVRNADGPLTFTYDDQFLKVEFNSVPVVGEEQALTVHYHGVPHRDPEWGGFYFESGYAYNLGIGLSTIPPNFGKVWYPCFDSFVERATYTYHVKSAGTYRFHGQGNFLGEEQLAGDTVVRSFELPQSIPTHLSAVAVSAYVDHDYVHSGVNGDIPVRLSAKSSNLTNMISKFVDLGAAIDVCEYWYGPYGYDRVGYVLTTDGALEIPTNVAYPQFMVDQSIVGNRGLFTHELGHHWWGDVVTPYVHNEMWLKEGPAEYSGHLIEEWIYGRSEYIKVVKDNHFSVLRTAHVNDGGYQPLSPMPDPYIYGTHTYYKGASVMHNLRGYMGDELFRQALRGIQMDLANSTITSEGFKDALEAHSGLDLDPFFDAWVFAPGYSVFEVRQYLSTAIEDAWIVDVEVGQKLLGTEALHEEVPLTVSFLSADGEVAERSITVSGLITTVSLDAPFEPAMVVLNRGMHLNQARMDNEVTLVPGVPFSSTLPYVDFRVYGTELVDSTLVRVDHIYSGADQSPLPAEILEVSATHYWNVDGLWPDGTVLGGRLFYNGGQASEFDFELIDGNEYGMALLFRATANEPWTIFQGQSVLTGNLTNGHGSITFENMQRGQYAFGKTTFAIGIGEGEERSFTMRLGPVPTSTTLGVSGRIDGQGTYWWDVIGSDGRLIERTTEVISGDYQLALDVSDLATGTYVLRATDAHGIDSMDERFQIIR